MRRLYDVATVLVALNIISKDMEVCMYYSSCSQRVGCVLLNLCVDYSHRSKGAHILLGVCAARGNPQEIFASCSCPTGTRPK